MSGCVSRAKRARDRQRQTETDLLFCCSFAALLLQLFSALHQFFKFSKRASRSLISQVPFPRAVSVPKTRPKKGLEKHLLTDLSRAALFQLFLVAFGCFWLLLAALAVVRCFWLLLVAFGCFLVAFGCFWLLWLLLVAFCCFLAAFGCFWLLFGCFWLLLGAFGCFWLLLVAWGCSWLLLLVFISVKKARFPFSYQSGSIS